MKFLDILSQFYYTGNSLVSNEVFDELAKKYNYQGLGTSKETEIYHDHRMYSLQKVYPGDKVPFEGGIESPKLDGAAVSVKYINGCLTWAATRGDGIRGRDITDKMRLLAPVVTPEYFSAYVGDFQVTGEVVTKLGKDNLRNYASGALNLKDMKEFATRELYFIAYDMVPSNYSTYTETMKALQAAGFHTILDEDLSEYPTDGIVVRLDNNKEYQALGFTSKHPRGAYALKQNREAVRTKLLDIDWNVGRSGVVSPVAILEPVDIEGALVSRATLHNWKYIEELDLEKGCTVEVIRAGEIIPQVLRRVYD